MTIKVFCKIDESEESTTFINAYTEEYKNSICLRFNILKFISANISNKKYMRYNYMNLRLIVRNVQSFFGTALKNVGFVAACLLSKKKNSRTLLVDTKVLWEPLFEPDAAQLAATGDGANKINQAIPNYFTKESLRNLTGIEIEENDEAVSVDVENEG